MVSSQKIGSTSHISIKSLNMKLANLLALELRTFIEFTIKKCYDCRFLSAIVNIFFFPNDGKN